MKITTFAAVASAFLVAPAFADGHASGDAVAGESVFKKCKSCHMIVDADGEAIQKGGRSGPNLYGIFGRTPGSEDFKYYKGLAALGETGAAWDEASFVAWVADPSKYLSDQLGQKERSKMTYKLKDAEDATNLWAYLVSVGPEG